MRKIRIQKPCRVVAAWLFCLGLTACATREDVRVLQEDVQALKGDIQGTKTYIQSNVQPGQADIFTTVQGLNSSIEGLRSEIESNREGSTALAAKLDDLQASVTARLDALYELLAGSKFAGDAAPSALFNQASSDFARSRYDVAIEEFQHYLQKYPVGEKSPEATLRIGECEARQKKWSEAGTQLDHFISSYPNDALIATALYDKGQVLEQAGKPTAAVKLYEEIVQKYSYRPEAPLAQDRLKELAPAPAPTSPAPPASGQ